MILHSNTPEKRRILLVTTLRLVAGCFLCMHGMLQGISGVVLGWGLALGAFMWIVGTVDRMLNNASSLSLSPVTYWLRVVGSILVLLSIIMWYILRA